MEKVLKFRVKILPGQEPIQETVRKYREQFNNAVLLLEKNQRDYRVLPEYQEGDSLIFQYVVDI